MPKRKRSYQKKIIPVKPRDLIRIFEKLGYKVSAKTKGHTVLRHPDKIRNLAIPNHPSKEVQVPVILRLIENAGITRDDFLSILNNL